MGSQSAQYPAAPHHCLHEAPLLQRSHFLSGTQVCGWDVYKRQDMNNYDRDNIMLEQESFDIHKAVKMTCESLEGTASNKKITFTYNFCEPEELLVYADKQKILQVLRNLCDNAIKFSHEESEICLHTFRCV